MANEQNLVKGGEAHKLTAEEQSNGGKASAEARRQKRDLRLALEMLLERDYTDKGGKTVSGTEAITAKLFEQAMKGNVKAFETLRDTVGQKPVEVVAISTPDNETIERVESALFGGGGDGTRQG